MKLSFQYFLIFLLFIVFGCKQVRKAADVIAKPSAREGYERNFPKNDSLLFKWNGAFETAKKDKLQITLPYSESGIFSEKIFNVYSYNVQLKEGERIVAQVEKQPDSAFVFLDFFQQHQDSLQSFKLLKSSEYKESKLSFEIKESGFYKIIMQPEMKRKFPFILKIYTQPIYAFPISGGENKNIQGYWADPRDTGSRSHEGLDIFADRGTPVIAVTDGIISSIGEKGIGGKQVWLDDGIFGKTIYYAHLDSIAISSGKKVRVGDTLGFVGNTGNAQTSEPHLHFGIYKANSGAINPLSFIKKTEIQTVGDTSTVTKATVVRNGAEVRKGPASVFEQFASLKKNDTVVVLGKNQKWFHIQTSNGLKGFVNESTVKPLPSN